MALFKSRVVLLIFIFCAFVCNVVGASEALQVDSDVAFRAAPRTIRSTRRDSPAGWHIQRRADLSASIHFFLALKQQNLAVLEDKFWSVSDPKSAEYRQFLSIEEISDIVAPKPQHVAAVTSWLLGNGVTSSEIYIYADALEVHTAVSVAEQLFQSEFYQFHHAEQRRTVIRQFGSFSVPAALHPIIDVILGITNFPQFVSKYRGTSASESAANSGNNFGVVAQTMYGLYNISSQSLQNASSTTSQGIIAFAGNVFGPDQLQQYAELVGIPITPLRVDHVIGNRASPYGPSIETQLDLDMISTVNIEAMNWFWLEDDSAWLYAFTTHFFNTTNVPQVISISYGWWEGQQCLLEPAVCSLLGLDSDAYVTRINNEFKKIGLRGVSILVSSGDNGAHSTSDPDCSAPTLRAEFPGSSPYVTSVGATQIINGTALASQPQICTQFGVQCAASGIEVAVSVALSQYTSGGGFSEVAPQPRYQQRAVNEYLNSGIQLPSSRYFNASNRGLPDVSAVGSGNLMYRDGIIMEGGTSASAPIFAAIAALLNQASIANCGQPLGFLNPLLYHIAAERPDAFQDVTVGDNICPQQGCNSNCTGYFAASGWDPVTGLGTPNYGILLEEVRKLGQGRRRK